MKVLVFGIDNRALLDYDGHSKRWNKRVGEYVERLDVIVEVKIRDLKKYKDMWKEKKLSKNVRILPVYVPHPFLYPFVAYRKALSEYKRYKYDLISCEDPFRAGFAGFLFKIKTGIPLNVEYHIEAFFNKKWLNERFLVNRIYDKVGRVVIKKADSIRCVNKKNLNQLKRICGDKKLIKSIPVPTLLYEHTKYSKKANEIRKKITKKDGDLILLYVGRLVPVKRVDRLIEAFVKLRELYKNIYLVIVGEGVEYRKLVNLSKIYGSERIVFKGYVPEKEVMSYYGSADIFVNPAYVESYGRVYVEAMSAGLPIVTTYNAGAVEDGLLINGVNSILFNSDDVNSLEEALRCLIEDEKLRKNLGENGYRMVREKFDYEILLKDVISLWMETINISKKKGDCN